MIDEENQHESVQSSASGAADVPPATSASTEGGFNGESSGLPAESVGDSVMLEDAAPNEPAVGETLLEDVNPAQAELENELRVLKAQLEERTNQCVRIAADFDNYRKRTQREREDLEIQVKCSTINELLPVVDNFERARSQIKPQTEQETTIHKSYQSVYKQLVECLKRIGVAPMRSEGKEFDPSLHEAVMRQPTSEYPEGTVVEELQRGYLLGDRVLRHALVKVAAAPEPGVDSEENDQGVSEG